MPEENKNGEYILDLDAIADEAVKKKTNQMPFGEVDPKEDEITLALGDADEEVVKDTLEKEAEDKVDDDEDEDEAEDEEDTTEKEKPKKKESRAQKRIRELVLKAKEADERALASESEKEALRRQLIEREDSGYESQKAIINSRIEDITDKLVRLQDEGETAKAVEAQKELIKLQTQQMALDNYTANRASEKQREQAKPKQQAAPEKPSESANEWLSDNAHWFGLNQERTQAALKISKVLEAQGYDLSEPDTFEELDKRLGRAFPDMAKKSEAKEEVKTDKVTSKKPPQTTAGAPHTPAPKSNSKRVVRLSTAEMALADKNNISYQEWAKLKAAQEQSEDGYTPVFIE